MICLRGAPVALIERLDRREARDAREHLSRACASRLALSGRQLFDEVGERSTVLGRLLRERGAVARAGLMETLPVLSGRFPTDFISGLTPLSRSCSFL